MKCPSAHSGERDASITVQPYVQSSAHTAWGAIKHYDEDFVSHVAPVLEPQRETDTVEIDTFVGVMPILLKLYPGIAEI